MTPEEIMLRMMGCYPNLFKTKQDWYNQIFCVIGNGMHWENGCLVDKHSIDKKYSTPLYTTMNQINNLNDKYEPNYIYYPISSYSTCVNMPDDITKEWREELVRFVTLLFESNENSLSKQFIKDNTNLLQKLKLHFYL